MDFFDDFNSMFSSMWNKFNRPVKDQVPYSVYKSPGKGFVIICNTLGIDKKDLTVNISKEKGRAYPILRVKGETTIENIGFHNTVDLSILLKLDSEINDVQYELKNGLTLVYIKTKIPEDEPKIEAKFVDDEGSSLDW